MSLFWLGGGSTPLKGRRQDGGVPDRILIVERDAEDPGLWRYGLAGEDGRLGDDVYRLRHDPDTGSEPVGEWREMLWPTVILLVRRAGVRNRIVYNLTRRPVGVPEPPPRPPERRWARSTSGKSKERGETLRETAERAREGHPRAAA
jgi:hypothetical protein